MAAKNLTHNVPCVLTHKEIAKVLTARGFPMTAKVAWHLERRALRKIASDPVIRQIAQDMGLGSVPGNLEPSGA